MSSPGWSKPTQISQKHTSGGAGHRVQRRKHEASSRWLFFFRCDLPEDSWLSTIPPLTGIKADHFHPFCLRYRAAVHLEAVNTVEFVLFHNTATEIAFHILQVVTGVSFQLAVAPGWLWYWKVCSWRRTGNQPHFRLRSDWLDFLRVIFKLAFFLGEICGTVFCILFLFVSDFSWVPVLIHFRI